MGPKIVAKKLSKKEQLELLREQARQREEEEKIRQEEEEKKKKEQERLRKIEEERLAAEEKSRLMEEGVEYEANKVFVREALENAKKAMKISEDWEKFLMCSTKPDSVKESELTTFITMYKESKQIQDLKIQEELDTIQYSESIVQEISQYIQSLIGERKELTSDKLQQKLQTEDGVTKNQDYIKKIRLVTLKKLEEICAHLVINVDTILEEKQAELQKKQIEVPTSKGYKQDDKQKIEIFKIFPPLKDFKFGVWINPNSKQVYRHKPIDFLELEIQCEVPRTLMSNMLIMKVSWLGFDYLSQDIGYMKDITVGGVLDIECLELLQLTKKVNNWTLKMNYDFGEALRRFTYPQPDSSGQVNYSNVHPVKVYYSLPSYVWVHESDKDKIRVGVFDKLNQVWQTEQVIEDIKFDPDKKVLTFNAFKVAPFAFLLSRCTDYPYLGFKLRCVSNEKAVLDIESKRDTFRFHIYPGYIILVDREDSEFQHLVGKMMLVGTLLYELSRCGVNFMPVEQDAQLGGIAEKDTLAEDLAIQDISQAARSFYIESSRWSQADTGETIIAKIKENLEYDTEFAENQEKDWKVVRWWRNKCAVIQARDSQSKCNFNYVPGTVSHRNLEILLREHKLTPNEAIERMKDLHKVIFTDTISQVLRLTKILSFTSA